MENDPNHKWMPVWAGIMVKGEEASPRVRNHVRLEGGKLHLRDSFRLGPSTKEGVATVRLFYGVRGSDYFGDLELGILRMLKTDFIDIERG